MPSSGCAVTGVGTVIVGFGSQDIIGGYKCTRRSSVSADRLPLMDPNVERFTGFADIYELYRPKLPLVIGEVLSQLAGPERPVRVVDIGSGTGLSTRRFKRRSSLEQRSTSVSYPRQWSVRLHKGDLLPQR